jgi:branched-chain amino acid aminotransferase
MNAFSLLPHNAITSNEDRVALLTEPGFGRVFTDHMVIIRYTDEQGWHDATLGPRGPISLDPAAAVLHYAQEIFEGLKAYRLTDGGIASFRPNANAHRFNQSAVRLAMPQIPEEMFVESIRQLVSKDRDWVPAAETGSLYLRPFMFADEPFLGVRPARSYLFCVIASPDGGYFKGDKEAVTIWVSPNLANAKPKDRNASLPLAHWRFNPERGVNHPILLPHHNRRAKWWRKTPWEKRSHTVSTRSPDVRVPLWSWRHG